MKFIQSARIGGRGVDFQLRKQTATLVNQVSINVLLIKLKNCELHYISFANRWIQEQCKLFIFHTDRSLAKVDCEKVDFTTICKAV